MKKNRTFLMFLGVMIAFVIPAAVAPSTQDLFVGSTPCDPYIKSMLKIGDRAPCEFIKWKMDLNTSAKTFTIDILYGLSLPNTNEFQNGGTKLTIRGPFKIVTDIKSKKAIYQLSSENLNAPLAIRVLDDNVMHLLGADQNLLVGNGGFSYSLNRQQP